MPTTSDAILDSITIAERHMRHEYEGDWEATLDTVDADARYALAQPGFAKVINGHQGISDLYHGMKTVSVPQASRVVAQLATDWYYFFENFPTRLDVQSGEKRTVHTATLAPRKGGKLVGEFLWERNVAGAEASDAGVDSLRTHERLLEALRAGDAAALSEVIAPDALWAERDYVSDAAAPEILELNGAAAAIDYCRRWHAAQPPQGVSILNRLARSWYVFAEELWTVAPAGGPPLQVRKAVIYPLAADGRIKGALGWGCDPAPAEGPSANVGTAFWERVMDGDTADPKLRGRQR
jgi:hypothetical protein